MEQGRVDEFKADVSRLRIRTGDARRDGVLRIAGAVLMAGGIIADLVVYESSRNLSDPRDIQSQIVLAIGLLGVTGAGCAVFLYASLARFFRFWLLRQVYESRSQVDQVVAAFQPRASATQAPELSESASEAGPPSAAPAFSRPASAVGGSAAAASAGAGSAGAGSAGSGPTEPVLAPTPELDPDANDSVTTAN